VQQVHRHSTRVFGALMIVLGAAMLVVAVAGGGGPASFGVILGVLFAALGAARLYMATHAHDGR
jgi:hypothetical protein